MFKLLEGKSVETVYYFFLGLPGLFEGARSFIQPLRVDSALLGAALLMSSWRVTSAMVRSLLCFQSFLATFRAASFCLFLSAHRPLLALVLAEQHPFHFAILKDNVEDYGKPVTHRDGSVSVYIKDRSGNNIEILRY